MLLREVVREHIHEAVLDGTLEPGEPLHDKELQEWLGVSRTPIRDALNELARAGFIEMEPNRFTRVAIPQRVETLESMQTLGVLLGGVVRFALLRLSVEDRRRPVELLALTRSQLRAGEWQTARRTVLDMWDLLAEQCGNGVLHRVYADTAAGLMFKLPGEFFAAMFDAGELDAQMGELEEAMRDGAAVRAELVTEKLFKLP